MKKKAIYLLLLSLTTLISTPISAQGSQDGGIPAGTYIVKTKIYDNVVTNKVVIK